MTSLAPPSARIPGYNLTPPGEADVAAALERVYGAERATRVWADCCARASVPVGQVNTAERLDRAVQALAAEGGASATVARSIVIRLRTYAQLAARNAATNTGARS